VCLRFVNSVTLVKGYFLVSFWFSLVGLFAPSSNVDLCEDREKSVLFITLFLWVNKE